MTKRIPCRSNCLFKVLDLLANFLQLRFAGDDALRDGSIVCLCAEGIEFAKNFLGDEFERTADRLVLAKMMRELREVTFHARQFLREVGAVGEEGNFFQQTFLLSRDRQSGLLQAIEERGTISFYHLGMKGADFLEFFPHRFEP